MAHTLKYVPDAAVAVVLPLCVAFAAASIAAISSSNDNKTSSATRAEEREQHRKKEGRLDVYMMDDIARLSYLNRHRPATASAPKRRAGMHRGRRSDDAGERFDDDDDDDDDDDGDPRPRGVPTRLRLLVVDIPEFKREAFASPGACKLPHEIFDLKKPLSFADGVAPPRKPAERTAGWLKTGASRKPIVQKSLARQLYYCYDPKYERQRQPPTGDRPTGAKRKGPHSTSRGPAPATIGVEILEASVMNLNPNNIRRIYTSSRGGRWKNVVGDSDDSAANAEAVEGSDDDDGAGVADADEAEAAEAALGGGGGENGTAAVVAVADGVGGGGGPSSGDFGGEDAPHPTYDPDRGRSHPANQFAWLEEMRLRTGGLVPFGAPMERAGLLSRWMYGRAYRQSVPAASPSGGIDQWLRWFWWPWRSGRSGGGRDGVDGEGESGLHGGEEGRRRCEDDDDGVGVALRPRKSPPGAVVPNRASNKP